MRKINSIAHNKILILNENKCCINFRNYIQFTFFIHKWTIKFFVNGSLKSLIIVTKIKVTSVWSCNSNMLFRYKCVLHSMQVHAIKI